MKKNTTKMNPETRRSLRRAARNQQLGPAGLFMDAIQRGAKQFTEVMGRGAYANASPSPNSIPAGSQQQKSAVPVDAMPSNRAHKIQDRCPSVTARKTSPTSRVAQLQPPDAPITFLDWRDPVAKQFPCLAKPAEVCLSVVSQLLLNDVDNPFALALVDVPSSGKTTTLNFIDVPELVYTTDTFTPASFVSHASNVKREALGDVDLLPRIRHRTLIVRDLAPLFGAKQDDVIKSLAVLTRVLDGQGLETDSGVHGQRGYQGDYLFMLLAGTIPPPPRVYKIMGHLGGRLFFLGLHSPEKSDDELIAQNRGSDWKEKVAHCRSLTGRRLRTLWAEHPAGVTWDKSSDPDQCLRIIARCARLLARLRGVIDVGHTDNHLIHSPPVIENPDRINCLLYNLARGHALVCGRRQLSSEDIAPVLAVTLDSAPGNRSALFRCLLEEGGALRTSHVERVLHCSKPTALKEMESFLLLGLVEKAEGAAECGRPEAEIRIVPSFSWFLSSEFKTLRWP